MLTKLIITILATTFLNSFAIAETFEIKMLNKGAGGKMIYEPNYLAINIGDTVLFLPSSKGHNAQTIKGMIPDGAEKFKSKVGKEFSVTLMNEGIYGIKCTPHYSMGMVALIQVGAAVNLDAVKLVKQKGKAKGKMKLLFEQVK